MNAMIKHMLRLSSKIGITDGLNEYCIFHQELFCEYKKIYIPSEFMFTKKTVWLWVVL